MGKLDGKIAVVTGGNSGIGYATAERFVAEGATVVVTGRREAAVNEAVEKLSAGGGQVSGVVADQAVLEDSDRLVETIRERHGRIDVLFVNAGVAPMAPFAEDVGRRLRPCLQHQRPRPVLLAAEGVATAGSGRVGHLQRVGRSQVRLPGSECVLGHQGGRAVDRADGRR